MNQFFLFVLIAIIKFSSANENNENSGNLDPVEAFKVQYVNLFKGVRKQHFDAIKRIIKMDDKGKTTEMIRTVVEKSFEPLAKAESDLIAIGSVQDVLEKAVNDENIRNSLSLVLENAAFHGDLALHFPDTFHKFYDNNKDFQKVLEWAYDFAVESQLYDEVSSKMLNLMAQELDIIPKSENFINPYKQSNQKKKKNLAEDDPRLIKEKKKREKKKRGPGMSRTEL